MDEAYVRSPGMDAHVKIWARDVHPSISSRVGSAMDWAIAAGSPGRSKATGQAEVIVQEQTRKLHVEDAETTAVYCQKRLATRSKSHFKIDLFISDTAGHNSGVRLP